MKHWDKRYVPRILDAISANPPAAIELLNVAGAAYVPSDQTTIANTVVGVLWYNVFATNDAVEKLGGQPFDNSERVYVGSTNDILLNETVKRYSADDAALQAMETYFETTGKLARKLVTMHTTLDEIVPEWHEQLYIEKVEMNPQPFPLHTYIPVPRYGHCNFQVIELINAFGLLTQGVPMMTAAAP
jgi:hypothetical protein